jgi:hypothetical protein
VLEFGCLTVVVHLSLGKKNLGIESFEIKKERVKKKQASLCGGQVDRHLQQRPG